VKYGPVDVVILATGEPKFDGTILAELGRLVQNGTIRVLDAMLLAVGEDGERYSLDIEELGPEAKSKLGFIETGTTGLFDSSDAETIYEGMVPGSAIVALAIENAWAVPLLNAFAEAGTELAMHTRVPAPIVDEVLGTLATDE
jgi:hypothetical protein